MTLVNSRLVRGRCPCGAMHAACGPPSTSTPVDENWEVAAVGGPLKLYDVVMHGVPTRMKLNEADAERYSATLVGAPDLEPEASAEPSSAEPAKPAAKKRTPANKARTATADKDGGTGGGD